MTVNSEISDDFDFNRSTVKRQTVIELLSSDDENNSHEHSSMLNQCTASSAVKDNSSVDTSLLNVRNPSFMKEIDKSNSSKMRMEYAAYRDKHFSLPSEERNERALNMQEFIWSKIPPDSGPYQYDSNDSRDMKMKKI